MPQYAVLIYEAVPPEQLPPEIMQRHLELPDRVAERGGRIALGLALEPNETATAIRGDLVTDGPFIETKEQLGGFILVDVPDLNAAIQVAARIPLAKYGAIEVRPIAKVERIAS
jgi:hypothetical protein